MSHTELAAAPTSGTRRIVRRAAIAAYVVAGGGLLALVTIGLFFAIGQPWGTLNDLVLLVMTAAVAPMMLAFWELGGVTPTPLALVAQVSGWIAVAAWCLTDALMILGVVQFDYGAAATGAFAVQTVALVVIGLWVARANLLAGPWLTRSPRWLGVVAGIGSAFVGLGLLLGGMQHPLSYLGGLGYLIVFPIWAFLMARLLRGIAWTYS